MKLENIVIYCGSHFGAELSYASFAGELAEAIAKSGRTITYGGGTVGLMGIVADAAMAAGGTVIGVIWPSQLAHDAISCRSAQLAQQFPELECLGISLMRDGGIEIL